MKIQSHKKRREGGYILLSIMLLITLMLITLTIELPRISQQIKREKEEELIHRGNEYKSAIRKFFRKFGRYPLSVDQLENTNNIRFLRKRYKDPFTGKDDWRLLHVGEVQLNLVNPNPNAPGQPSGQTTSTIGQPTTFGSNQPGGFGTNQAPSFGATPATPSPTGTQPDASQGQNNAGMTPASSMPGAQGPNAFGAGGAQPGMGPIIGVASTSKLESIKEIAGKNHYNDWLFYYDPRQELQTPQQGAPGINGATPIGGANPGQLNSNPGSLNGPGFNTGPGQMPQQPIVPNKNQ